MKQCGCLFIKRIAVFGLLILTVSTSAVADILECDDAYHPILKVPVQVTTPVQDDRSHQRWLIDGPKPLVPYEKDFQPLLLWKKGYFYVGAFGRMMRRRMAQGMTAHVLDLAGSGFFLGRRTRPTSMTGLRFDSITLSPAEIEKGFVLPPQVIGDINRSKTWEALDRSLSERGIPELDLVVFRPAGGWAHIAFVNAPQALANIIQQVVPRLSATGEFYFAINSGGTPGTENLMLQPELQQLARSLNEQGFRIDTLYNPSTKELIGLLRRKR